MSFDLTFLTNVHANDSLAHGVWQQSCCVACKATSEIMMKEDVKRKKLRDPRLALLYKPEKII